LFGYNTALNIVQHRVNALVYPYHGFYEQQARAEYFARLGLVQCLDRDDLRTPERLRRRIRKALDFEPPPAPLDLGGAQRTLRYVDQLLC
jgi:predicted glycosyltransferase